jgi:hypothetical protein
MSADEKGELYARERLRNSPLKPSKKYSNESIPDALTKSKTNTKRPRGNGDGERPKRDIEAA